MIDTNILVRSWLLATPSITNLLTSGTNPAGSVYASDLPKGADPQTGPVIQITNVGGISMTEIPAVVNNRKQIRVWAGVQGAALAKQVYGAIYDLMHGANMVTLQGIGTIIISQEVVAGQDVTDPETGWATVIGFFQITARN